jgi:predicted Na+-dependent transporter
MDVTTSFILQRRYFAQIAFVALLTSLVTFATVRLEMPPSPWHITWMVVLPFALGVAFNRGMSRWLMAPVLPIVSLIATMVIGNAMGGI